MDKKNIILTESQLEDLIKNIVSYITGDKSANIQSAGSENFIQKILSVFKGKNKTSSGLQKSSLSSRDDGGFKDSVQKIIDLFEGGYYHPDMNLSAMGDSGETMYGIDRKHGPESKTGLGQQFWALIDDDRRKKPSCYKLEYDPSKGKGECYNPELANKLKDLIASMMKPEYDKLSEKFLSAESRQIVNSNPDLTFNFTYLVWNGSGYFQEFSKVLNKKVASGEKNPNELAKYMLDYRKNYSSRGSFANNLIRRGGKKMANYLDIA